MTQHRCPLCLCEVPLDCEGRRSKVFHYECWGELSVELRKEWNAAKRAKNLALKQTCMRRLVFEAIDLRVQRQKGENKCT